MGEICQAAGCVIEFLPALVLLLPPHLSTVGAPILFDLFYIITSIRKESVKWYTVAYNAKCQRKGAYVKGR